MRGPDPQDEAASPSAGVIRGTAHYLPVRVYYEDTDFTGVVYHAGYLRFFERGRTDFLRLAGVHHQELWARPEPLAFTVRTLTIDYLVPARVDDALLVETTFRMMKGAVVEINQMLTRRDETLAQAAVKAVIVNAQGRPRRAPEDLRQALARFMPAP